jgi:hypothetical protein
MFFFHRCVDVTQAYGVVRGRDQDFLDAMYILSSLANLSPQALLFKPPELVR